MWMAIAGEGGKTHVANILKRKRDGKDLWTAEVQDESGPRRTHTIYFADSREEVVRRFRLHDTTLKISERAAEIRQERKRWPKVLRDAG